MAATELKLQLDGTFSIVVSILGQNYTLTTRARFSPGDPSTGGGDQPDFGGHLKLEYHSKSDEAVINLGTPAQVMAAVQDLLAQTINGNDLITQWNNVKTELDHVPILNQAVAIVDNTMVSITDIELVLDKSSDSNKFDAGFTLGLLLTPAPDHRPTLLNTQLVAFGANLHIGFSVAASDLGFSWPS